MGNDLRKNPDIRVLLSIDPSSFPLGTGPKPHEIWHSGDYPVVWTNTRYRMVYMNMGHNDMDYDGGTNRQLSSTFPRRSRTSSSRARCSGWAIAAPPQVAAGLQPRDRAHVRPSTMDRDELQKRADALRWYDTIDLGQGVVTRGVDNTPERLARVHLPEDLSGKTVLDIGAWDGFFSSKPNAGARHGWSRATTTRGTAWAGGPAAARTGSSWRERRSTRGSRTSRST